MTVHKIEDSITEIRVVEYVTEPVAQTKLNNFYIECTIEGKNYSIAIIKNDSDVKVLDIDETNIVFANPYEDCGTAADIVRRNPDLRLHSLFFAVRERPPYVPEIIYVPELPDFEENPDPHSEAYILISIYEEPGRAPIASATIFIRKP